jgi:hypothetical protein
MDKQQVSINDFVQAMIESLIQLKTEVIMANQARIKAETELAKLKEEISNK